MQVDPLLARRREFPKELGTFANRVIGGTDNLTLGTALLTATL